MASKKMIEVLKTLSLLERMPVVGELEGDVNTRIKASDITFWSGCNRMTVWRSLTRLEKLGIVESITEPYKNTVIKYYTTTPLGQEFRLNQKEMF